jgi:hypothetical protein
VIRRIFASAVFFFTSTHSPSVTRKKPSNKLKGEILLQLACPELLKTVRVMINKGRQKTITYQRRMGRPID